MQHLKHSVFTILLDTKIIFSAIFVLFNVFLLICTVLLSSRPAVQRNCKAKCLGNNLDFKCLYESIVARLVLFSI